MPIQERAVEILSVLCSTFGSFYVNTLLLETIEYRNYSGNDLFLIEMGFFIPWFIFSALLASFAHPRPKKIMFLIVGSVTAILLIVSSPRWISESYGVAFWVWKWFEAYAHYLIVIPIFYITGFIAEKLHRAINT